jgi:transcriptional regulator with XRE-family HTH domain
MTNELAAELSARTVRAIRKQLGLTQPALAARLGVKVLTVKRWEAGDDTPTARHQKTLAALVKAAPKQPTGPVVDAAGRTVLRIADALAMMGLQNDGKGRVSDRTLRNALNSGALKAWKVPGYRLKEWRFFRDDFERWLATGYHAYRDPRGQGDR